MVVEVLNIDIYEILHVCYIYVHVASHRISIQEQ